MQGVGPVDAVEAAGGDDVERAARHDLLRGLEDEADPAGELVETGEVGEHETGAEHRGRVHVVPARVRHPGLGGRAGEAALVGQRQRVDVRAEQHARALRPDVADEARAGQELRGETGPLQPGGDPRRRADLAVARLGMRVEVTPEGDELFVVRREERDQVGATHKSSRLSPTVRARVEEHDTSC